MPQRFFFLKHLLLVAILTAATAVVWAQVPAARFEVASVKTNRSGPGPRDLFVEPNGRFVASNIPVTALIALAFDVPPPLTDVLIARGPGWTTTDRFDVMAIPENRTIVEPNERSPEMRMMVRNLLVSRFAFAYHYEDRETDIYALRLDRSDGRLGPRLRQTVTDCGALRRSPGTDPPATDRAPSCGLMLGPGIVASGGVTMGELSSGLSMFADRVIVDQTGLPGYYEAHLEFSPELGGPVAGPTPAADPGPAVQPSSTSAPGLFTAIREQLGLKLERSRGAVKVLIIDGIERPTPD